MNHWMSFTRNERPEFGILNDDQIEFRGGNILSGRSGMEAHGPGPLPTTKRNSRSSNSAPKSRRLLSPADVLAIGCIATIAPINGNGRSQVSALLLRRVIFVMRSANCMRFAHSPVYANWGEVKRRPLSLL